MKKLIFLLLVGLLFAVTDLSAQKVDTITLNGAATVSSGTFYKAKAVTAEVVQLGGTSDGTLTLYGSTNGSQWVFLNFVGGGNGVASPKASITGADLNQVTITDNLVANWSIPGDTPFNYYKVVGVGTASDTSRIDINWARR